MRLLLTVVAVIVVAALAAALCGCCGTDLRTRYFTYQRPGAGNATVEPAEQTAPLPMRSSAPEVESKSE